MKRAETQRGRGVVTAQERAVTARQLGAAMARLKAGSTVTQVRQAHDLAAKATVGLEGMVARLAAADADGHRQHAIKQARNLKDARGHRRPPATMPGFHIGRPSPNKGKKFDPTPPNVNDVLRMLAAAPGAVVATRGKCASCGQGGRLGDRHLVTCSNPSAERTRAAILLLWRGGFRVGCELTQLRERDLHPEQGYVHVAHGKGGKARDVVVDDWVWPMLEPWLAFRQSYPDGPLFCVIEGATAGVRRWDDAGIRRSLHTLAAHVGIRYQGCGTPFRVVFSYSPWPGREPLSEQISDLHYGDTPNAGCCPAGPTMNSVPIRVLEFWTRRDEPWEWQRVPELERPIDCDWTDAEPWDEAA